MAQNARIYTEDELNANTMKKSKEEIAKIKERQQILNDFKQITIDDCPEYLSVEAKEEFRKIIPQLQQLKTSSMDAPTVAQYCTLCAICKELTQDINENGSMIDGVINPALKAYQANMKELRATASMLGLNPSSRAKLVADLQKAKVEEIEKEAEEDYFGQKFGK